MLAFFQQPGKPLSARFVLYVQGECNGSFTSDQQETAYWGVPWEESYGYPQARQVGNEIYVSGQFNHDEDGNLVAPAPLNSEGKPSDFSAMGEQMRTAYDNISKLLALYSASLDDVVDETLFVLDMDAAFAVVGKVRKATYGNERPQCASNIIGTISNKQRMLSKLSLNESRTGIKQLKLHAACGAGRVCSHGYHQPDQRPYFRVSRDSVKTQE